MFFTNTEGAERVGFWGEEDGKPLPSYCAAPGCATGTPCDKCRVADGLACYDCGRPAVLIDEDALCAKCECKRQIDCYPEVVAFVGALVARSAVRS